MAQLLPGPHPAANPGGRLVDRRTQDYDCFYASVFERETPALRQLPLAVQQKQIIVTCNYEARRRGLHKLQLVNEAKKKCPDLVIVLGEDLTRFRDASKELYAFLQTFSWNGKVERLGFDEVFMDVTDMIDYNLDLLSRHYLGASFFHLDRNDPTVGFDLDAKMVCGHTFPLASASIKPTSASVPSWSTDDDNPNLYLRLVLGSHLAQHVRHQLEEQKGYTSTVGVSTNKLVAKLVGNLNKPKGQTTLVPPYFCHASEIQRAVTQFIDAHEIGKIPGIGFKLASKIRAHVLGRPPEFDTGLIYGGTKEALLVAEVRSTIDMGPDLLETLLGGPGAPKGIGDRIWGLMNGLDNTEVSKAKNVPQQISVEDSYMRLNNMKSVKKELKLLTSSLIRRLHIDLIHSSDDIDLATHDNRESAIDNPRPSSSRQWIAHPKTLRLSTRPRPPMNSDGSRSRSFTRISKSCNMPSIVFSNRYSIEIITERIVNDSLVPLFRKLHPDTDGWDLSLINLCATGISYCATDDKNGAGRDIGNMFKNQHDLLKEWKFEDVDVAPSSGDADQRNAGTTDDPSKIFEIIANDYQVDHLEGSEDQHIASQESYLDDSSWADEEDASRLNEVCHVCRAYMPAFAMVAHQRFHALQD